MNKDDLLAYIESITPKEVKEDEVTADDYAKSEGITKGAAYSRLERLSEMGKLQRREAYQNGSIVIAYSKPE